MRQARFLAPSQVPGAFYHCTSRVVGRQLLFDNEAKDYLVELMRDYEKFCGVQIVAYCVMCDHFHLLISVSDPPETAPTDKELIARVRRLPGNNRADIYEQQLAAYRKEGRREELEALRRQLLDRMFNLGPFMKTFKQTFTQWYNGSHRRRGTMWEERYHSVLVEDCGPVPGTVAAYIDLNPVRADLVDDPKDYRWCSYADAMDGGTKAREGLRRVMSAARETELSYKEALTAYQELLFGAPDEPGGFGGKPGRPRMTLAELNRLLEERGQLELPDYLRLRVRYFTDGTALGRERFVDDVFDAERRRFGPRRRSGARLMKYLNRLDHYSLRDLQLRVLERYVSEKA